MEQPPSAVDANALKISRPKMAHSPLNIMSMPGMEPGSPATLSNITSCHSIRSDVSGKDPFWRHFGAALLQDEEQAKQPEHVKTQSESWLARQHKKTRRSKLCGFLIALVIVLLACGAGIAIWILSKNGWFRQGGTKKFGQS